MAQRYPELEPLRQLEICLRQLRLRKLKVGSDGFNRCYLRPFASRTGRNQPSNSEFIFGPAIWERDFLIQPKPDWGIAYIDWVGQEFGIAAGLSGDPAMQQAYNSDDIYLAFGKQAGVIPAWATVKTHPREQELFKVCVLATQYGQGYQSSPSKSASPTSSAELLDHHHRIYRRFVFERQQIIVVRLIMSNERCPITHRFKQPESLLRNFDMQAMARRCRLAVVLAPKPSRLRSGA